MIPTRVRVGRLALPICTLACLFVSCLACAGNHPSDYDKTPVLLVHGIGMSAADWEPLRDFLAGAGYPSEFVAAVDIQPNTLGNIKAAEQFIAPAAERLLLHSRAAAAEGGSAARLPSRIDIVSHSMGALSSRWYATRICPEQVRTWIAIAGAHHGSATLCEWSDEGADELCPPFAARVEESFVQVALNGTADEPRDETPWGLGQDRAGVPSIPADGVRRIVYLSIYLETDWWIKPERSAILDGAGGVVVRLDAGIPARETSPGNLLFSGRRVDHGSLIEDRKAMRMVLDLLSIPLPEGPVADSDVACGEGGSALWPLPDGSWVETTDE